MSEIIWHIKTKINSCNVVFNQYLQQVIIIFLLEYLFWPNICGNYQLPRQQIFKAPTVLKNPKKVLKNVKSFNETPRIFFCLTWQ